jgi:hypothetical protein
VSLSGISFREVHNAASRTAARPATTLGPTVCLTNNWAQVCLANAFDVASATLLFCSTHCGQQAPPERKVSRDTGSNARPVATGRANPRDFVL